MDEPTDTMEEQDTPAGACGPLAGDADAPEAEGPLGPTVSSGDEDVSAGGEAVDAEGACSPAEAASTVEALLFASDVPLRASRISLVGQLSGRAVRQAVQALNERYDAAGCTFCIEEIAGGYQMLTRPEYHDVVGRLVDAKKDTRLSQAAMETLAIVAYRQPILRADIEAIRGVASGEVLRGLMERQLLKIVGRAEVIGRPMLYGTTRRFLEVFGLNDLDDLPKVEELRSGAKAEPPAKPAPADACSPPEREETAESEAEEAESEVEEADGEPAPGAV